MKGITDASIPNYMFSNSIPNYMFSRVNPLDAVPAAKGFYTSKDVVEASQR